MENVISSNVSNVVNLENVMDENVAPLLQVSWSQQGSKSMKQSNNRETFLAINYLTLMYEDRSYDGKQVHTSSCRLIGISFFQILKSTLGVFLTIHVFSALFPGSSVFSGVLPPVRIYGFWPILSTLAMGFPWLKG
jgi:hypothetical protein